VAPVRKAEQGEEKFKTARSPGRCATYTWLSTILLSWGDETDRMGLFPFAPYLLFCGVMAVCIVVEMTVSTENV
jgi:hypothetical protein